MIRIGVYGLGKISHRVIQGILYANNADLYAVCSSSLEKANAFKNMVCNGGNGLVIDEELVMNIPLEKENCIRIIEEADKLGYGWCLVMDDTKDVYMKDTLFLDQVGKRKEPTRYIIDDTLDIYAVENY